MKEETKKEILNALTIVLTGIGIAFATFLVVLLTGKSSSVKSYKPYVRKGR